MLATKKGNSVSVHTFVKWGIGDCIGHAEENGRVFKVWCKTCAKYSARIKGQLRGKAAEDADNYVVGTNFVTKHNLHRHLSGKAHIIGLELEKLDHDHQAQHSSTSTSSTSSSSVSTISSSPLSPLFPRIDEAIAKQSSEAYCKLLKTAYLLAVGGQPLSAFKTLVTVQKANGVPLISGNDSSDRAKEFIYHIAAAIRQKIAQLLSEVVGFSILTDGSQARKTGGEKELIFVRLIKEGLPVFLCTGLANIDDYGDANADNLKMSIDSAILQKLKLSDERYKQTLVAVVADGASVNFGVHKGVLTQLKADGREWLLPIHCVCHRVELAFKDTLLKVKDFNQVRDFMITLYYHCKRSGKFKRQLHATAEALGVHVYTFPKVHGTRFVNHQRRQLHATAEALGVHVYTFPKVHGTRFVNHQRRGLQHLLHNWIVLILTIENALANAAGAQATASKLRGILKHLKDLRFLVTCCLYKAILDIYSKLSLKFENNQLLCFEVLLAVEKTESAMEDLLSTSHNTDSPASVYALMNTAAGISVTVNDDTNSVTVSQSLQKKGHHRRKEVNREFIQVSHTGMTYAGTPAEQKVKFLKEMVLPQVSTCLQARFASFKHPVFQHCHWLDPANWSADRSAELQDLQFLAEHFSKTLALAGFDPCRLRSEWRDLRLTVQHYYKFTKCINLWQALLRYRRKDFPNICMLAELVLAIGVSNSVVESGFSRLTCLLSDRRLSMSHDTMESMLIIQVNDVLWTESERNDLIKEALACFLQKRRKQKMETTIVSPFCAGYGSPKRMKVDEEVSGSTFENASDSDTDSDNGSGSSSDSGDEHLEPEDIQTLMSRVVEGTEEADIDTGLSPQHHGPHDCNMVSIGDCTISMVMETNPHHHTDMNVGLGIMSERE